MKREYTIKTIHVVMVMLVCAVVAGATDYYVDTGNTSASDSNPGSSSQPWKTIAKANSTLKAGDQVYIKGGTYSGRIEPARSGTSAQQLITYTNFGSDVVTISNIQIGIQLIGKSYIKVKGINCTNLDTFLYLEGSSHNIIENCTFTQMRTIRLWAGSKIIASSQYNWVHHCTFGRYGYNDTDDHGEVFAVGEEDDKTDLSFYNLIENNNFYHGGHDVVGLNAKYTVVRNNTFHNENWQNGHGNRNMITSGYQDESGWCLIEGNRFSYSGIPADAYAASGLTIATRENIIRRNYFYHNNGNGLLLAHTTSYTDMPSNNKIYGNTFFHNGFNPDPEMSREDACGLGFALWSVAGTERLSGNIVKNNLFWKNAKAIDFYDVRHQNLLAEQTFAGNREETGDPLFINASTTLGDPFDTTTPNLGLAPNSPCINAGVFLTKITSSSGSGTSFQVEDPSYFMDGWGIIQGDTIQIQGDMQRAMITHIDSATKTVTVNASLTWTQNQGISLAYGGTAPDIGAFEFDLRPSAPRNLRIVAE